MYTCQLPLKSQPHLWLALLATIAVSMFNLALTDGTTPAADPTTTPTRDSWEKDRLAYIIILSIIGACVAIIIIVWVCIEIEHCHRNRRSYSKMPQRAQP